MKTAIVYYSYTGNTRNVAVALSEHLASQGEVSMLELKPVDESTNFFKQGHRAMQKAKADLGGFSCDMSGYDRICIGTPVWACAPVPAVNAFLEKCSGMQGKKAVLFCTVGGLGANRTLKLMRKAVAARGVQDIAEFSVRQKSVADKAHVLSVITDVVV